MVKSDKINAPICGLILTVLSLGILGSYFPVLSFVFLVLGTGIAFMLLRGSRFLVSSVIWEIIALFALGIQLSSVLICFILFCSLSSAYIINREEKPLPAVFAAVAASAVGYLAVFAITEDAITPLCIPAMLIIILSVCISVRRRFTRTAGIAFIAVGIAVPIIAALLAALWSYKGSISLTAIREVLDEGRDALTGYLKEIVSSMSKLLPTTGNSEVSELIGSEEIELIVTSLFNMIPAIAVITVSAAAFFIQRYTYMFIAVSGKGNKITGEMALFRMSAVSGALFIISVLVSFIASRLQGENAQFVSLVANNFYLILIPGLIGTGTVLFFTRLRAGKMRKPGVFTIVLGLITAFLLPSAFILIIAYFGAIGVIYEEIVGIIKSRGSGDNDR